MATASYQKIELITDIDLYFPFYTPTGGITAADRNDVVADQTDRLIILPDATLAQTGSYFLFNNIGLYSFKLMLSDGITELASINSGEIKEIALNDNSTSLGEWSVFPYGSGQNAITTILAVSANDSLVITGSPIDPPSGVFDFTVSESLNNFNQLAATGFPTIKTTDPLTFATVELVAGDNILIANSEGVLGDPVISLNSVVSGLSSMEAGDITISGSIITSNIENGDIDIVTSGTGVVNLNGVTIDSDNNIANVNNLTISGAFNNPFIPSAWCVFTDTVTGTSNTIVNQASENITSVTGNNGRYVINFTDAMSSINYGVVISLGSNGDALPPPVYHAYFTVRETTSVTIAVLDASGEFVQSFPDGVTVVVMDN